MSTFSSLGFDNGIYTEEEIDEMIADGYIPIATADELDRIRIGESQEFGDGTKWKGSYKSGVYKKYIQVEDLNLGKFSNFTPIGNNLKSFRGVFDGGGYEINNLTINQTSDYTGLFGYVKESTLRNIGLVNVNISGETYTGGMVGLSYNSSILDSHSSGNVKGDSYTGGMVGWQRNISSIKNSYSSADVVGSANYTGGLVGEQHSGSSITNSYATGSAQGELYTGGLVGLNATAHLDNSYATGNVSGGDYYTGGLIGRQYDRSTIDNSYATGDISGGNRVGGLLGEQQSNSSMTKNSYVIGKVEGRNFVGGLIGNLYSSNIVEYSFYDVNTTNVSESAGGVGKKTAEMKQAFTYTDWDQSLWDITDGSYPSLK